MTAIFFFITISFAFFELKSVEKITNAHKKQLLTYLKLSNTKLGFILNFGEGIMAKLETARKMKTMGFLTEQIQAVTGISTETIIQL